MEISFKNRIIKNKEYEQAMDEYKLCMKYNFDKIKRRPDFNKIINDPSNADTCIHQINEIKKAVLNGGLDYENFKN